MRRAIILTVGLLMVSCGRATVPLGGGSFPPRFVAQTTDGRIVLVRTADGSVDRILAEVDPAHNTRFELTDDQSALFLRTGSFDVPCAPLVRIDVTTRQRTTLLAETMSWDVSHDGIYLVYGTEGKCGGAQYTVAARDLRDGSERRWSFPFSQRHDLIEVDGVKWLQDDRHIYVTQCGADMCGPILLDTAKDKEIGDSPALGCETETCSPSDLPGDPNKDWFYGSIMNRGAHSTEVGSVEYSDMVEGTATSPFIEFDPLTMKMDKILYRSAAPTDGTNDEIPVIAKEIVDFDASGDAALLLDAKHELFLWDLDRAPLKIGGGYVRARW